VGASFTGKMTKEVDKAPLWTASQASHGLWPILTRVVVGHVRPVRVSRRWQGGEREQEQTKNHNCTMKDGWMEGGQ
jgi:hypothetical protein